MRDTSTSSSCSAALRAASAPPPPSSPSWLAAQRARPLRGWSAAQREALCAAIEQTLSDWRSAWGLAEPGVHVHCDSDLPPQAEGWQAWPGESAGCTVWGLGGAAQADLVAALFGEGAPVSPLAAEVAAACAEDALDRLAALFGVHRGTREARGPCAADTAPWSGAFTVGLPAPLGGHLVVSGPAVHCWLQARGLLSPVVPCAGGLAPVAECVATRRLTLRARMAGCTLTLGDLATLRPGDVVRLDQRLDAPLCLADGDGAPVLAGYLARQGERLALELTRAEPAPGAPATSGGGTGA